MTLMGLSRWADIWIFLVADFLGGAAAALVYKGLDLNDDKSVNATRAEQAGTPPGGVHHPPMRAPEASSARPLGESAPTRQEESRHGFPVARPGEARPVAVR